MTGVCCSCMHTKRLHDGTCLCHHPVLFWHDEFQFIHEPLDYCDFWEEMKK